MRRWILSGLRRRRQADDGRPIRQADELLRDDDLFDFVQPLFKERQYRVAGYLLLLELMLLPQ